METKYYPAETVVKEALCDVCKSILRFVRSDFERDEHYNWLHTCDNCGKNYWLDNRYPMTDSLVDLKRPLSIETDPIQYQEDT